MGQSKERNTTTSEDASFFASSIEKREALVASPIPENRKTPTSIVFLKNGICLIIFIFCFKSLAFSSEKKVTYFKDIAPLMQAKCVKCHQKNGNAPFSLETYDDVSKRKSMIAYVVKNKIMPPWPAERDSQRIANSHFLSDKEISMLSQWAASGVKKGKSSSKQPANQPFVEQTTISAPALDTYQISMPKAYQLQKSNENIYVKMDVPSIDRDLWICGSQFHAGSWALHHSELYISPNHSAPQAQLQVKTYGEYFNESTIVTDVFGNASFLTNWLPGNNVESYPVGTVKKIKKNDWAFFYLHYASTPTDVSDSTFVNLFVLRNPPPDTLRKVEEIPLIRQNYLFNGDSIFIPANQKDTFTISIELEKDYSLFAVHPHAHQLALSMHAYAITPQGDSISLIHVPKWDFNWQFIYKYRHYIHLPKGTKVYYTAVYDNTAQNPRNPFSPPRNIRNDFGEKDEMMVIFLMCVPYKSGDELSPIQYWLRE